GGGGGVQVEQTGSAAGFAGHLVDVTTLNVLPFARAAHTPAGGGVFAPDGPPAAPPRARATEQRAGAAPPPAGPGGAGAMLRVSADAPAGAGIEQSLASTGASAAPAKQLATSRHPAPPFVLPASAPPASCSRSPSETASETHAPSTHVCPSGHVETTS